MDALPSVRKDVPQFALENNPLSMILRVLAMLNIDAFARELRAVLD